MTYQCTFKNVTSIYLRVIDWYSNWYVYNVHQLIKGKPNWYLHNIEYIKQLNQTPIDSWPRIITNWIITNWTINQLIGLRRSSKRVLSRFWADESSSCNDGRQHRHSLHQRLHHHSRSAKILSSLMYSMRCSMGSLWAELLLIIITKW